MQPKLKIIITGASGFVGQHLLEDIDAEKYDITIVTRNKSKVIRYLPEGCTIVYADLLDAGSLADAFAGKDVLINLAAEVRDMERIAKTNINGTENLIEAIKSSRIKQVIHLSSVGIVGKTYNNAAEVVDEETEAKPQNEYERTKYISERLLLDSNKNNSYNLIIVRPTNVFGEYHPFNALLGMMKHIQSGKPVAAANGAVVNYVYVKDLTALICRLIGDTTVHGIVNVGKAESLKTFFSKVAGQLKVTAKSVTIPVIFIKFAQLLGIHKLDTVSNKISYSDKKLSAFFQYPYGTAEGLKKTVQHYKKLDLIK